MYAEAMDLGLISQVDIAMALVWLVVIAGFVVAEIVKVYSGK